MQRSAVIGSVLGALVLAGCTEKDPILTGDRMNVRDVLETRAVAGDTEHVNEARPLALPGPVSNASWTQSPVTPSARTANAALGAALKPLFSVSIGAGDTRRNRLNADPVVADGRIFTMDSESVVKAVSTSGAVLWSVDLTPEREKTPITMGGGLALGDGKLFVTSGYGAVVALDVATGKQVWEQKLGNSASGAPSYADGLVYVVSGDSTGWAIEAGDGRVRWQIDGQGDVNNVSGAPAPAVGPQHVVFSFGTGAVQGAFRQGGLRMWNAELLGRRQGITVAGVDDITGDPLIAGDVVYAGNHSGRVAAMSVFDGERIWTAPYGALGPVWPAGDSVFFVSDMNRLVRLDATTGDEIWKVDLPGYVPVRKPSKKRDTAYANLGPVLAGSRLLVASSDGQIRQFDPVSGALLGSVEIPGGATTRPVVAGGTLYVVSKKGVLHAFR